MQTIDLFAKLVYTKNKRNEGDFSPSFLFSLYRFRLCLRRLGEAVLLLPCLAFNINIAVDIKFGQTAKAIVNQSLFTCHLLLSCNIDFFFEKIYLLRCIPTQKYQGRANRLEGGDFFAEKILPVP